MFCEYVFEILAEGLTFYINRTEKNILQSISVIGLFIIISCQDLAHKDTRFTHILYKRKESFLTAPAQVFSHSVFVIKVRKVNSRRQDVIEQLLTRGSTSITRGVRQNSEEARKEQQLTNNSEETHKRRLRE